jgi:hypothetical protein
LPADTLRQQELWQLKQEQTKKEAPSTQSALAAFHGQSRVMQPETTVTVGSGKALVTAETKQLPQDIQRMYTGAVVAEKLKAKAELEKELERKAAEAKAEAEKQIRQREFEAREAASMRIVKAAGAPKVPFEQRVEFVEKAVESMEKQIAEWKKQAIESVEQQISQWKQEQLQAAGSILEAQAQQKVKGEVFTALAATAGIGAVVATPVLAVSSAVGGVVFETTKTGIMEKRLPTTEEVVTAAGVSAASAAILSGVGSAVAPAVSGAVSKVAPTVAGKLGAAGEALAASGLKGFAAREIVGSVGGAVFGGAEAAIEGKDVLKGAVAGAVAGAAGMAAAQITYSGLSRLEQELLGVKAYRVKGGESRELFRETDEAIGKVEVMKVDVEPTRITKQQAEVLRYMQTEEVHMAGTRNVILKGGGDVLKYTEQVETVFKETASDIMEAASRGGGIIGEMKFRVKAPEFIGERLMMPEYAAATTKYTGVQVFGKIDPQVYLSYVKNVPPQISQSWLTQMGGLPVEQLTQVTRPINVVAHEVFALPVQRIPLTPFFGTITPPSSGLKTFLEEPSIITPKLQPQFEKTAPEPFIAPLVQPKTTPKPEQVERIVPHVLPKVTPKPSLIDLPNEILRPEPKHKPEPETVPDILPQVVPAVTPQQKPKPAVIPEVTPVVTPEVTPKPVVVPEVASTVTPKVTPSPILETSPTPTPAPVKPKVLLPPWMREEPGKRFGGVAGAILGGKYVKKHQIALPGEVAKFILGNGKQVGRRSVALPGLAAAIFQNGRPTVRKTVKMGGGLQNVIFEAGKPKKKAVAAKRGLAQVILS